MALQDRFDSWDAPVALAFFVGAAGALFGSIPAGIGVVVLLNAVLSGLLWAFAVYIFVSTFHNYVESYAETGGSLRSPRFLTPFVVAALAGVALFGWRLAETAFSPQLVARALSVSFWAFVITMALVLVWSYAVAGYHEGTQ